MAARDGKRKILSLEQRVEVLKMLDKGSTTRAVAAHFGCGRTQVSSIKGNKDHIMKEWEAGTRPTLKYVKRRKMVYENVNTKCYEWFLSARAKHMPVSGRLIQVSKQFDML